MNDVRYNVDISRAERKLSVLDKKLSEGAMLSVKEIGELGKNLARMFAPYRTGKLFRNIVLKEGGSGYEAVIMAQNPTYGKKFNTNTDKSKTPKFANFNLVRWMHESPLAIDHIHSGNPRFMYKTRDELERVAPKLAGATFNKIVVSTQ